MFFFFSSCKNYGFGNRNCTYYSYRWSDFQKHDEKKHAIIVGNGKPSLCEICGVLFPSKKARILHREFCDAQIKMDFLVV